MSNHRYHRFINRLRCPQCHHQLRQDSARLECLGCAAEYPIVNEIPILMNESSQADSSSWLSTEEGKKMVAEYAQVNNGASQEKPSLLERLIGVLRPPEVMLDYRKQARHHPRDQIWCANGRSNLVLNVGGGPQRESDSPDEITLNLQPFYNVDLVGDAHNLPAQDNCFDAVLSMAVLEHVNNPQRVVAEMIRVLKPGGQLYSEVPFIFFYHGYPSDYTRFTRDGMKQLFSDLEEVEVGMTHGPVSATLQCGNTLLQILVPTRLRIVRKLINGAYRWLFFVFKYLDLLLKNREDAHLLAGGFYVVGRKPAE